MNLAQMSLLLTLEDWVHTKGWLISIASVLTIIIVLFILPMLLRNIIAKRYAKKNSIVPAKGSNNKVPAEVQAAIGIALYLSTNLHDEESNVITITRRVSSWNDKHYGIRQWKR